MLGARKPETSVTAAQAAAFRLERHHLAGSGGYGSSKTGSRAFPSPGEAPTVLSVVRDTAGIQAQVQSAAELAIWTRRRQTTRDDVRRALWNTREIVKTSAMRLTLHLIPARDLAFYIAALKPMAIGTLRRWQARIGATPSHVRAMVEAVVDSLGDEPETQQQLVARAKKSAGKAMRSWLDHAWSAVRPAVIEGLIVYGPPRGAEATFVRVDRWLGKQPTLGVDEARVELLRRFLSAFGPATPHDFAKWSGIRTSEAKRVVVKGFFLNHPDVELKIPGALRETAPLVASGAIRVPIAATYPLTAFREAVAHVQRGGKVMFDVDGASESRSG